MTNEELLKLYDSDLALRLHNAKDLSDTRKMVSRFLLDHLNGYPPSPELAKAFLAQYADRKPRTIARYAKMIKSFMKWYGEPMDDFKVKVLRTLPPYTEDTDIEKLFAAIENKQSHRGCIVRDSLLVALALKTGMRRAELANLGRKDIYTDFLLVRSGKGGKDRLIPLGSTIAQRPHNFIKDMESEEKAFKLKPVKGSLQYCYPLPPPTPRTSGKHSAIIPINTIR